MAPLGASVTYSWPLSVAWETVLSPDCVSTVPICELDGHVLRFCAEA